jgi:hypothetical protein
MGLKPSSVVYWSRLLIAIATGVGSVFTLRDVVSGEMAGFVYPAVAFLVYAVTAVIFRYQLGYGEAQLKGKNRYITLGIGTFIITWLMALVLTYTVLTLY